MRPLQASTDHKRREAAQSRAVKARDKKDGRPCCRLERRYRSADGYVWRECGKSGQMDTVHIIPRRQCGNVWDDPAVALTGCRECHDTLDLNIIGEAHFKVRVPYDRALFAWNLVVANTKVPPPARYNPTVNDDYADIRSAA
jgi:5-methylcytosine-specific restriction endonuclease McrA